DVSFMSGAQLSADSAAGGQAQRMASSVAVVMLSTRGLERHGRELLASYVRDGGGLFIVAGPDVDGEVAADVLGGGEQLKITTVKSDRPAARTLAPADLRHPVFRPFAGTSATLSLVRFQNASRIDGSACQTLAR